MASNAAHWNAGEIKKKRAMENVETSGMVMNVGMCHFSRPKWIQIQKPLLKCSKKKTAGCCKYGRGGTCTSVPFSLMFWETAPVSRYSVTILSWDIKNWHALLARELSWRPSSSSGALGMEMESDVQTGKYARLQKEENKTQKGYSS